MLRIDKIKYDEMSASNGYVNILKAVRYVFTDGFDEKTHKQVGAHTGSISDITCFEEFYSAFIKQIDYLIETTIRITNEYEKDLGWVNPSNMYKKYPPRCFTYPKGNRRSTKSFQYNKPVIAEQLMYYLFCLSK